MPRSDYASLPEAHGTATLSATTIQSAPSVSLTATPSNETQTVAVESRNQRSTETSSITGNAPSLLRYPSLLSTTGEAPRAPDEDHTPVSWSGLRTWYRRAELEASAFEPPEFVEIPTFFQGTQIESLWTAFVEDTPRSQAKSMTAAHAKGAAVIAAAGASGATASTPEWTNSEDIPRLPSSNAVEGALCAHCTLVSSSVDHDEYSSASTLMSAFLPDSRPSTRATSVR